MKTSTEPPMTNDSARELLREARFWIRGCLDCKDYEWDSDQRECAEGTVASITALLSDGGGDAPKRIQSAQSATMPEPVAHRVWAKGGKFTRGIYEKPTPEDFAIWAADGDTTEPLYGPEVLDLLATALADNEHWRGAYRKWCDTDLAAIRLKDAIERLELAESRLAAEKLRADEMKLLADYCKAVANEATDDRKRAESRLAKVMEALREPTPEMLEAMRQVTYHSKDTLTNVVKAMSSALLRSVDVGGEKQS